MSKRERPGPLESQIVGGRYRTTHYRGFRLEKAQAGWTIWRGRTEVGWEETKARAMAFVDRAVAGARQPSDDDASN